MQSLQSLVDNHGRVPLHQLLGLLLAPLVPLIQQLQYPVGHALRFTRLRPSAGPLRLPIATIPIRPSPLFIFLLLLVLLFLLLIFFLLLLLLVLSFALRAAPTAFFILLAGELPLLFLLLLLAILLLLLLLFLLPDL